MKSWSIGEVARLLGVKPYIIRYWESELPLLSPKKGLSGRREYGSREISLLLRFRHFLYEKKFTIEGAKRMMWEELGTGDPDIAARFSAIRADLVEALMTVRRRLTADVPEKMESAPGAIGVAKSFPESGNHGEWSIRERFASAEQGHLFAFWESRPERMKRRLMEDLQGLELDQLRELRSLARSPAPPDGRDLAPASYISLAESASARETREIGEGLIRSSKTAFLTVAGGQGSRLGYDGPKGMFPISPIRRLTLFALFAERLLAARRWYGVEMPWLVMTSPHNLASTEEYFRNEGWFGLGEGSVSFFEQGMVPALAPDGSLLIGLDGGLFLNPNGHGGVVDALRRSGLLQKMRERGVEELFYFQIDNPLVRVPDPLFLGFHRKAGSEISSKVVEKAFPEEKLGLAAHVGGKPAVIEYSDIETPLMLARDSKGDLVFSRGSIAIHILNVDFLSRQELVLPWHLARKKAKTLNPTPRGTEIVETDTVKMERFIFDAIPLAREALFFETDRVEEFAPLKNREGIDSVATCLRGQVERHARWLAACGVDVPRDSEGRSRHLIEISPLFAMDASVLAAKRGSVPDRIDDDTLLE
jgi:UDP-N-acetylglucosamine/UDP-N-acetylgalactosamine diphosphorylase